MRAPLILVPGTMATSLSVGDQHIWPPTGLPSLYAAIRHIGQPARPGDVVREVRVLGIRLPIWQPVLDALTALGYQEGVDMFVFGYDWRGDVRDAAGALHDAVPGFARAWRAHHDRPADDPCRFVLAAHSLGTVVARWYVDHLGGHAHVAHQLLVAAVDRGNPFAFAYLANGLRQPRPLVQPTPLDFFIRAGPGFAGAVRQLRALYQVLPTEPFVSAPDGPVDITQASSWVGSDADEVRRTLDAVRDGWRLQHHLAAAPRVPTTYLYGTGHDTIARYYVRRDRRGDWDWAHMTPTYAAGDGAVLSRTARPADLRADVKVVTVDADHQGVLRHERFFSLVQEIGARVATGPQRSAALRAWARSMLADPTLEAATHQLPIRVIDLQAPLPAPRGIESVLIELDGARRVALWGNLDLRGIVWHFARRLLDGQDARVPVYLRDRPAGGVWPAIRAAGALMGFDEAATREVLASAPIVVFMDEPAEPGAIESLLAEVPRSEVVVRDRARRFVFEAEARVFALSHAHRTFRIALAAQRLSVEPLTCDVYAAVWPAGQAGPAWDETAVVRVVDTSVELPVSGTGAPATPTFHVYPSVDDDPRAGADVPATGAPVPLAHVVATDGSASVRIRVDLLGATVATASLSLANAAGPVSLPWAVQTGLVEELVALLYQRGAAATAFHDTLDRWERGLPAELLPEQPRSLLPSDRIAAVVDRCLRAGRTPTHGMYIERYLLQAARGTSAALPYLTVALRALRAPYAHADAAAVAPPHGLRPQATVGDDDLLPAAFAGLLEHASRAVARLTVPVVRRNKPDGHAFGTGWLIASDLLVTNYHVIAARPRGVVADADDVARQVDLMRAEFFAPAGVIAVADGGARVVFEDRELDVVILRLRAELGIEPLRLQRSPVVVAPGDVVSANIVQHPDGADKRLAIRNNLIYRVDDVAHQLHYAADTRQGSSGAPVLDDDLRVIGVHVGAVEVGAGGVSYNVGAPITAVLARLGPLADALPPG